MKVFAALHDDVSDGHVWLKKPDLPPRCVVTITNENTGNKVYCEALQFDDSFLREYNNPPRFIIDSPVSSIVMSYWYRAQLGGLETQHEYPLSVAKAATPWGSLKAGIGHPEVIVRVAIRLAVWSVFLGAVGILLGIVGLLTQ